MSTFCRRNLESTMWTGVYSTKPKINISDLCKPLFDIVNYPGDLIMNVNDKNVIDPQIRIEHFTFQLDWL